MRIGLFKLNHITFTIQSDLIINLKKKILVDDLAMLLLSQTDYPLENFAQKLSE